MEMPIQKGEFLVEKIIKKKIVRGKVSCVKNSLLMLFPAIIHYRFTSSSNGWDSTIVRIPGSQDIILEIVRIFCLNLMLKED